MAGSLPNQESEIQSIQNKVSILKFELDLVNIINKYLQLIMKCIEDNKN